MIKAHHFLPHTLLLLILVSFLSMTVKAQQGPQYTQFTFNNLIINPAFAGSDGVITLNLFNRSQWSGTEGAPSTLGFAAHARVRQKVGLGITFMHDQVGVHKHTTGLTNYAYHLQLNEHTTFSVGLQAGFTSFRSDYASLVSSANDPKASNSINETVIDFGSGMYLKSTRWQVGISAPKLFSNAVEVNDSVTVNFKRRVIFGYIRYRVTLNESFDLEPGILVKYFQNVPMSVDVNTILSYRKVMAVGFAYRHQESVDFLMRLQLTHQLQLAYAYDYPIQYASLLSSASHEIMVQYQFKKLVKRVTSPR
jgi:type IX secretion system PorP/SprF family membrane protein